MNAGAR